jgi:nitrogen fixation NifU-like protein
MDMETKREIILDNYDHPFNKVDEELNGYIKVNSANDSCIDNINLYIKIEDNIIKDIKFSGEACAISTASTSIMIKNMIGMTIKEGIDYVNNFTNMIYEKEYDNTSFNEANAFDETYKQGNRKTCATLPYRGIIKVLLESSEKHE